MIAFSMDVHLPKAITLQLRLRGVDVLTAQEDGADRVPDPELLRRAAARVRTLVTFDKDLLVEAAAALETGERFAGLVFVRPLDVGIGGCVRDLEIIGKVCDPVDMENRIEFLPL